MPEETSQNKKHRIVILGGGFAGVYAAKELQKRFKYKKDYEICLISRENYFTYQPMMAEIIGGSLGITDSVSALRNLLPKVKIYIREIADIDIRDQTIVLNPNFSHTSLSIHYDQLVLALGNVTDFRDCSGGIKEHALAFKNLGDAFVLRNRLIDVLEVAANEENPEVRSCLLTVVVGGGGFSGVEVVAEINDFLRKETKRYPSINPEDIRVVLVHSKDRLMDKELSESLSRYAEKLLRKRGVEIMFGKRLQSATPFEAVLNTGERINAFTIVSTVPSSPNPLIESLPFEKWKGRVKTDEFLQVPEANNVWALGDCAAVPSPTSEKNVSPTTAQFAIRQATRLAKNLTASVLQKGKVKPFYFKCLGMMAALGHHGAVAELFGFVKLSGFFAWMFWRAIYWYKLPGFNRKIKVLFSWLLDMIIPAEAVQLKMQPSQGMVHLHYEKGETIFRKGDIGDFLYIVVSGQVRVIKEIDGVPTPVATIGKGEYFGEMALLNEKQRNATIECLEPTDLIAIKKQDFHVLITNFGDLRNDFETTEKKRLSEEKHKIIQDNNIEHIGDLLHPPEDVETRQKKAN